MSQEYLDRNQQNNTDQNTTDVSQKRIDPVAQLKWLNSQHGDQGWGIYGDSQYNGRQNQPIKMFTQEVEDEQFQLKTDEKNDVQAISEDFISENKGGSELVDYKKTNAVQKQNLRNEEKGIKNGYQSQLDNAQSYVDNIKKELNKSNLSKEQRKINEKYLKVGEKYLKKVQDNFDETQALISKLKDIDIELFDEVNAITDSEGNEVDVYIKVRSISDNDAVYGTTNLDASKENTNIYRSSYGDKTVSVKSTNDVRILAHELGHVIYQVPNIVAYMEYYDNVYNSGYYKEKSRGHAPGDKSGEMVEAAMERFNRKYKKYKKINKK